MNALRTCLTGLACCAITANAQSWTELDTLVFTPHRPAATLPLAAAMRAAAERPERARGLLLEDIERLTATIAGDQLEHGQNAPELVDDLLSLARAHQQLGDHSEALVALERAQHIVRVETGLYSLDQVAAVEAMIASLAAADDYRDALSLESYLQELVARNPGDPRVVDVLTDMADRQMAAARHYLDHGIAPVVSISIGTGFDSYGSESAPTARQLARRALGSARANYVLALNTAIEHGAVAVPELLVLEGRAVDTLYFELLNPELLGGRIVRSPRTPLAAYALSVLDAKLANSRVYPGTPEAIAGTLVEIADWRLMFGSHARALDGYREAHRVLVDGGATGATIAALLSPAKPVVLPDFDASFASPAAGRVVTGWFDVGVGLSRYGRVMSFDVVDRSAAATDAVEKRFRQHLRTRRFRPRFVGPALATDDEFSMRYHFSYAAAQN